MREQAAVVSCDFLVEWLIREDIEKAGCSAGAKLLQFFETPKFFVTILWTHDIFSSFEGLTLSFIIEILGQSHLNHRPFDKEASSDT